MPTKLKSSSADLTKMKTTDIVNTVRAQSSTNSSGINFEERLPECVKENIGEIGDYIANDYKLGNAFLEELFNRIGLVTMNYRRYTNPLKLFKQGRLEYGESVEEIAYDLVKAKCDYNVKDGVKDVFTIEKEDVYSTIHKVNYQIKYPLSITRAELRKAFTSEYSLGSFIEGQMSNLYNSYEIDEFLAYKNLLKTAILDGFAVNYPVSAVTSNATGNDFTVAVKALMTKLAFPNTNYNKRGIPQFTPKSDVMVIVDADLDAQLSVRVLAYAFNMTEAEFMNSGIKVVIDEFPVEGLHGFICDRRFFQIYDVDFELSEMYNGSNRVWKYWLHVWEIISASPFMQAVALIDSNITPEVTAITVSPSVITTSVDQTIQFVAEVTANDLADESVIWSISGNTTATNGTPSHISRAGMLHISPDETSSSITVTATSIQTPSISGSATVTINSVVASISTSDNGTSDNGTSDN